MPAITSDNVALAIVKTVAAQALPVLVGNLFMARLVNRDFDGALATGGDTVTVPLTPSMVANNITETGTVQLQNPSLGGVPVTLTTHAEATFQIPDVVKAMNSLELIGTYAEPAMVAIAEKVEGDLFGQIPLFTYNAALGASNTPPTEAVLDAAETALFQAKVPNSAQKYIACAADFYSAVRQLPRFSEAQTIGTGDPIQTGNAGKIKDFTLFRSQYIKRVGGTVNNLAFTRDAMVLVTRALGLPMPNQGAVGAYASYQGLTLRVIMSYNPNQLGQQFTADLLYGTAVLRNPFGQVINS